MRYIFLYIVLLFPLGGLGQGRDVEQVRKPLVRWGAKASINLNIPGDWTSTDGDIKLGYGGEIGGLIRINRPSNFFIESGIALDYDNLKLDMVSEHDLELSRWSVSAPVTAGYAFNVTDGFDMAPLLGMDISYMLSDKLSGSHTQSHSGGGHSWNPVNISWGIGVEFIRNNMSVCIMGHFGLLNMTKKNSVYHQKSLYANKTSISFKYFFW